VCVRGGQRGGGKERIVGKAKVTQSKFNASVFSKSSVRIKCVVVLGCWRITVVINLPCYK
jgi:hypothetical protein